MGREIIEGIEGVLSGESRTQAQQPTRQPSPVESVGAPTIPENLLSNEARQQEQEEEQRQRDNQSFLQGGSGVYQPSTPTQNREAQNLGVGTQPKPSDILGGGNNRPAGGGPSVLGGGPGGPGGGNRPGDFGDGQQN